MINRKQRRGFIPFIFCILVLICPRTYARHFNPSLPPGRLIDINTDPDNRYRFSMVAKGTLTINGNLPDIEDEIGIFVKLDDGITWRLCGTSIFRALNSSAYQLNIYNYLAIDKDPHDGTDDVPKEESQLEVRIWDHSERKEYVVKSSQIDFVTQAIKNSTGNLIYKTNNLKPGTSIADPWILNISYQNDISIPDPNCNIVDPGKSKIPGDN